MNLEQARQLIGKYAEVVATIDPQYFMKTSNEHTYAGLVKKVIIGDKYEMIRLSTYEADIPFNWIKKWRVYEPGEWQE